MPFSQRISQKLALREVYGVRNELICTHYIGVSSRFAGMRECHTAQDVVTKQSAEVDVETAREPVHRRATAIRRTDANAAVPRQRLMLCFTTSLLNHSLWVMWAVRHCPPVAQEGVNTDHS